MHVSDDDHKNMWSLKVQTVHKSRTSAENSAIIRLHGPYDRRRVPFQTATNRASKEARLTTLCRFKELGEQSVVADQGGIPTARKASRRVGYFWIKMGVETDPVSWFPARFLSQPVAHSFRLYICGHNCINIAPELVCTFPSS